MFVRTLGFGALLGLSSLLAAPAHAQPFQDAMLYTAPVGIPSALGGPTLRGEVSILREQFFEATPPDLTGLGVTLDGADPDRDGLFSQVIFVRSGPVQDNSRNPETEATIVFPASVTVVGVLVGTAALSATDMVLGLAPSVDYTASARGMEVSGIEYARVVSRADGTTAVELRTNMNNTPFTDEFRVLIDHGTAWVPRLVATVEVTIGDDVNIGAADGGRTGEPTDYRSPLPLTHGCGDAIIGPRETCDDGNDVAGDGCDALCIIEPGFVCTGTPSVCGICIDTSGGAGTDLGCSAASPICVGSGTSAFCAACVDDTRGGTDTGCMAMAPACDVSAPPAHICLSCEDTAGGTGVDNGCTAATPVCGAGAGGAPTCLECTEDAHCGLGTVCSAAGSCVPGCTTDADCVGPPATPICDVAARACVECVGDAQCMGTELCTPSRVCSAPDTDGDGVPDDIDLDDDDDGIPDASEIDPTLAGDSDGDGVLDFEDPSIVSCPDTSPMDGVCDSLPTDVDFDGDGIANHLDLDADGDGIADLVEGGGTDDDGDGRVDMLVDANGDGLHDAYAASPLPLPNTDGDAGPDFLDIDADGDGVTDTHEGGGTDVDMDGAPDDLTDTNGDGIADALTGAGALPTPDTDMDGAPDYQDDDDDDDGIPTPFENPIAQDTDMDGTPDYLDPDDDGDGALTIDEGADPNGDGDPADARDTDGDGIVDYLDPSDDRDVDAGVDGGAGADAGVGGDGGGDGGGAGIDGSASDEPGGLAGGALCTVSPGASGSGLWLLAFLLALVARRRRR